MPLQGDQLSRMTIRGFKSIKNCDISFGKINVLIGSNGAGKSNFISAFSFLQNVLSKNLQVSVGQSGLSSLLYNGRKVTEEIDFEVFFGQNSYGFVLVPTDDNRLIFQKEYFGYFHAFSLLYIRAKEAFAKTSATISSSAGAAETTESSFAEHSACA